MFSSNKIKVIVCQRGARHRYTVPQIFEKADALSALYTDSSAYSTCGKIAYLLYRLGFRNQCITKLRKRTISHVALNKIFSKDIWSDIFINKLGYKLGVTNFSYPLHLVVDNFFLGRCLVSCCHLDEPPKKHPPIL